MDDANEDSLNDDLKIVKASAVLLNDLTTALPKLLWRQRVDGSGRGRVHSRSKHRSVDYIVRTIEPFQSEPQLLDSRLKEILPPIIDAYLSYLQLSEKPSAGKFVDFQSGLCKVLYTLCKVRGYKVILGFFNNEPKYFELVLTALEEVLADQTAEDNAAWQTSYILLLWVSHLLLTPFDLATISSDGKYVDSVDGFTLHSSVPSLTARVLKVSLKCLTAATKAQDAAAIALVRLVTRPDMLRLRLADAVVERSLHNLGLKRSDVSVPVYDHLGFLRFLSGVVNSVDLDYLIPVVYRTIEQANYGRSDSAFTSNAVAKKLLVKVLRNICILSLRSSSNSAPLSSLLESSSVLEETIDVLLHSLADRDTPVRYAAAKALSLIILELEPDMALEVIQAVLDSFKEDVLRNSALLDFSTANPLKWHGLTLCLGHVLFKRSASPNQLPDIFDALVAALNFEQRSATGSSIGTNVRDAANFGIWSLSRRYTTDELLSVKSTDLRAAGENHTVIEHMANQLIVAACSDPVGNIRRGSSAALQELIGRHPNQVHEGISLVQVIDYLAVGLRRRAIVQVGVCAAGLHQTYRQSLLDGLRDWRGLGSADLFSREAAATGLTRLTFLCTAHEQQVMAQDMLSDLAKLPSSDVEKRHGIVLTLAYLIERGRQTPHHDGMSWLVALTCSLWQDLGSLDLLTQDFNARTLQSELPTACARLISAMCQVSLNHMTPVKAIIQHSQANFEILDGFVNSLMDSHEESILECMGSLVKPLFQLKKELAMSLGCIDGRSMWQRVATDASGRTQHGSGRAIALGCLVPHLDTESSTGQGIMALSTLAGAVSVRTIEWRVVAVRALHLAVDGLSETGWNDVATVTIVNALHTGLNDYTINQRGDIGSLVRLQSISAVERLLLVPYLEHNRCHARILIEDLLRLSLEKLDRVRFRAAKALYALQIRKVAVPDVASASSLDYFQTAIQALGANDAEGWERKAILEGCISCAGNGGENVLQASRAAVASLLDGVDEKQLVSIMTTLTDVIKKMLSDTTATITTSALEFLGFLLDMQIPQRLGDSAAFKWRNLLSVVQKSHHKSNDIPKILAAVHVYLGLADVSTIRAEVLKKLVGMLRTNPYPRIRAFVAEVLFMVTSEDGLEGRDWTLPASKHADVLQELQQRYI